MQTDTPYHRSHCQYVLLSVFASLVFKGLLPDDLISPFRLLDLYTHTVVRQGGRFRYHPDSFLLAGLASSSTSQKQGPFIRKR